MKALIALLIFVSTSAFAGDLHLYAGGGLNFSSYNPRSGATLAGAGPNFKTDLLYSFNEQWSVEWSSQVKFNRVSEFFIWDTLMTFGIRHQFKNTPYYIRGFTGRAPTVVFLDDAPEVTRDTNASRLQYDGPVYGLGFGKYFESKRGTIWFIEYAASYQELQNETGIRNNRNTPVEVFSQKTDNPIRIFGIYATVGVRVF